MAEGKTASYAIRFDSNAVQTGQEGAASLEQLKASIGKSQDAVKLLSAAMRGLKGSSDDVKSAREQLKAQLEGEKTATTAATLALLKHGTSFEQLAQKEKAAAAEAAKFKKEQEEAAKKANTDAIDKLRKSIESAGGPVADLKGRISSLKDALSTGAGRAALFVGAIAGITAVAIAAGKAIFEAGRGLAEWIFESANAARTAGLMREAWSGSAANATALGHQLDVLSRKVDTPKEKLNELGGSLVRALSGTRVSGQGIVDTFNAVAQASAAMGDQAASVIEDIIKRSARFGRVSINPFELQGTGIKQQDVAAELAKRMNIGVRDAQMALLTGRVKVDDAAAALRAAVEKRFARINLEKMLDFDVIKRKLAESIGALTRDVKIEPLLKGFQELAKMFDTTTVSGAALKTLITFVGNNLVSAFQKATPIARVFFLAVELGALKIAIELAKARNRVREALGGMGSDFDATGAAVFFFTENVTGVVKPILWMIEGISKGIRGGIDVWNGLGRTIEKLKKSFTGFYELGKNVVTGIIGGIKSGIAALESTVGGLADTVKNAFKEALGIHSPSVVFERYGQETTRGYEKGLDRGAPATQEAAERMAPKPPTMSAAAPAPAKASEGRGGGKLELHIHIEAGGNAKVAQELSSPAFLRKLTVAIEDALVNTGLPPHSQAPV